MVKNTEAVGAVAKANEEFTRRLYAELVKGNNNNLIMSSFSVESVIAMLLAGAKGETAGQIREGLSLPQDEHLLPGHKEIISILKEGGGDDFALKTANNLYTQKGFDLLEEYLKKVQEHYFATPVELDFSKSEEARTVINDWVKDQTEGKIKDLIKSGVLTAMTRLVLVNAVYFKGDWLKKFDPQATSKQKFFVTPDSPVEVDMMRKKDDFAVSRVKALDAMALKVPYKGKRLSMVFFLPNEPSTLADLEKKLVDFDLGPVFADLSHKMEVRVALPKFKIESTLELNEPLKNLGLNHMFDSGKADLSGLAGSKDLFVSMVVQKAFVEVNEEGTEAAAATAGVVMMRAALMTPEFVCNRPFIFMIRDDLTGMILFAGRITDPSKAQ